MLKLSITNLGQNNTSMVLAEAYGEQNVLPGQGSLLAPQPIFHEHHIEKILAKGGARGHRAPCPPPPHYASGYWLC